MMMMGKGKRRKKKRRKKKEAFNSSNLFFFPLLPGAGHKANDVMQNTILAILIICLVAIVKEVVSDYQQIKHMILRYKMRIVMRMRRGRGGRVESTC